MENDNELDRLDDDLLRDEEDFRRWEDEQERRAQYAKAAGLDKEERERIRKENAYAEAMIARDRIESPAVRNAADLSTQGGTLQHAQAQYLANRRKS